MFLHGMGPISLTTWSLVFCIFFLVFVLIALIKNGSRSMTPVEDMTNPLPGPRGFIATAKLLTKMLKKASRHMFEKTKTYGKVFGIGSGPNTNVILMDYATLEVAFVTKADQFSDRGGIIRAMLESVLPERGSIFNNGTAWHESRGFVAQTIKNTDFGKNITRCIDGSTPALYSRLDAHLDVPFDPKRAYQFFCMDVLHRLAFGEDADYDSDIVMRFIDDLEEVVAETLDPSVLLIARPSLITTCLFGRYRSKLQSSSQYVKRRAEEVLRNRDATDEKLSSLIALFAKYIEGVRSSGKASYAEPDDGWVIVYNLFFAATDTIHQVLLWLTLFLASRPDIQEKMVGEIQSSGNDLSYENRTQQLPIVMSTTYEVLRMRPVAPMGVPHVASEKGEVDGYSIPEGCQLFSNLWGMHNDPDVWKDPELFNPDRFLKENGGLDEEKAKLVIPFSIGPRSCPGEQIARRTIFHTVVSLVSRYRITLPVGEPQPRLINEKRSFTMSPERFRVVFSNK